MKKYLATILVLSSTGLTACGPTLKSADIAAIEEARAARYNACVAAREAAEVRRANDIKQMDPMAQVVAASGDSMVRQAEAISGKDPCSQGMNAFEMETAIAKSRNEAITSLGGTAIRTTGAVGGAVVAADMVKSIADRPSNQVQIQGDGNSYTHEQMTVNSEMSSHSLDGAAGDQTAPVVTGPDKSTNTEVVAPEPEVVEPEVVEPEVEAPVE